MRLKEDSSSWKGMGLKAKAKPIPDQPVEHSKKDTRKWCLGKVGREHDYELIFPKNDLHSPGLQGFRKMPVCKNCGRQDYNGVLYRQKDGSYGKHLKWYGND